ncbi:MAG: c-type cytochrome [Pigmentiphaga sp.]
MDVRWAVLALAAGMATAGAMPAAATDTHGPALARSNACLACHQIDARRVGPPFREIGKRYAHAGDPAATIEYLAGTIQKGGRGRWGAIPMPAQPRVSDEDAQELAKWILEMGE